MTGRAQETLLLEASVRDVKRGDRADEFFKVDETSKHRHSASRYVLGSGISNRVYNGDINLQLLVAYLQIRA